MDGLKDKASPWDLDLSIVIPLKNEDQSVLLLKNEIDAVRQHQPRYDVIILKVKHMNLLKAVLNTDNNRIAAVEPVGSKRFVLLKYDSD